MKIETYSGCKKCGDEYNSNCLHICDEKNERIHFYRAEETITPYQYRFSTTREIEDEREYGDISDIDHESLSRKEYVIEAFIDASHCINTLNESREKTAALQRLEEAKMWAVKAAELNND